MLNARTNRSAGQVVSYGEFAGKQRTEDALHESQERLALVTEAATEGLYDWNIADNQLYVSPRLNRMFGFVGGTFQSETWNARVHPDDREIYRQALVDLFRRERDRLHVEYRMLNLSDAYIWVRDNAVAVRDHGGRAVRLVGAVADITKRKVAEAALRESEQRYELAMAAISEGVYDWQIETDEIYYSPRVRSALGFSADQLRTAKDWSDRIHPDDLPAYRAGISAHLKGDSERFEHEYRYRRADGTWGWARQHGLALRDDQGRAYRMAGSTGDITEEKRRAAELAEKTDQLKRLSDQLAKYLSPQVYASIFAGRQEVKVASRRKKITVFFSDIEDFTETTECLESEELTGLLNRYLTEMSSIALAHGATIDKFVGDAMMMFFGDPDSRGVRNDALACVRMAVAMQQRMRTLEAEYRDYGLERPFRMRIGINTGYCTVGNFGSDQRMDYTIIGNAVNLAARLQAHAEPGGILLAHETHALVRREIEAEQHKAIRLKGVRNPVRTYKVPIPSTPLAVTEDLIRKRLKADLANLDRTAALRALDEIRTEIEQQSAGIQDTDPDGAL